MCSSHLGQEEMVCVECVVPETSALHPGGLEV